LGRVLPYLSESSLQHYRGGVEDAVQHLFAISASKRAEAERDLIQRPTEAAFLRRVRGENLDYELPRSCPFVFREPAKLAPTGISDGLRQDVVPHHVPDFQVLERNQVVVSHEIGAQLVVQFLALSGDPG